MKPTFADLGLSPELTSRLSIQGFSSPFPIQQAVLPDALSGRDICGRAPTGSGKTLAFGLAIANREFRSRPRRPSALVLVPTRELAAQVQRELAALSKQGNRRVIAIYGGTGYGPTRQALARGADVVVACPGRLEDLVSQNAIDLGDVRMVVLDEADRMVDMGFLPAVRRLVDLTPPDRQMLLFSATLGREIETLVNRYQRDPAMHDLVGSDTQNPDVLHLFVDTRREDRAERTAGLVREHGQALIFCRTRRGADRLCRQLNAAGIRSVAIHGDRSQKQREQALASFARGTARALVATDVAARGIHVDELPCVVHYDLAADHTDYLHRSGRTGRAGKPGVVVSLVSEDQRRASLELQHVLGFATGTESPRRSSPGRKHPQLPRSEDRRTRSRRPASRRRTRRTAARSA